MLTAPPSAAPELLVCLPSPWVQDRVISKFISQIIHLPSLPNQELVCACRSSSSTEINTSMGKLGGQHVDMNRLFPSLPRTWDKRAPFRKYSILRVQGFSCLTPWSLPGCPPSLLLSSATQLQGGTLFLSSAFHRKGVFCWTRCSTNKCLWPLQALRHQKAWETLEKTLQSQLIEQSLIQIL